MITDKYLVIKIDHFDRSIKFQEIFDSEEKAESYIKELASKFIYPTRLNSLFVIPAISFV